MEEWYKTLLLVLSNYPLWGAFLSALLIHRQIEDAGLFLLVGLISPIYHGCQSGGICYGEDLNRLRPADHIGVWLLGTWIMLRIAYMPKSITFLITIFSLFFFLVFPDYLMGTLMFPAVYLVFFAVVFLVRFVVLRFPYHDFGLFFLFMAFFMVGGGLYFYFLASDIEGPDFWWQHSIWHVSVEQGMWLVYEALMGAKIFHLLGLSCIHLWFAYRLQRLEEWEGEWWISRRQKKQTIFLRSEK